MKEDSIEIQKCLFLLCISSSWGTNLPLRTISIHSKHQYPLIHCRHESECGMLHRNLFIKPWFSSSFQPMQLRVIYDYRILVTLRNIIKPKLQDFAYNKWVLCNSEQLMKRFLQLGCFSQGLLKLLQACFAKSRLFLFSHSKYDPYLSSNQK